MLSVEWVVESCFPSQSERPSIVDNAPSSSSGIGETSRSGGGFSLFSFGIIGSLCPGKPGGESGDEDDGSGYRAEMRAARCVPFTCSLSVAVK